MDKTTIRNILDLVNRDTSSVKVGITVSTFDLLHSGHTLMLNECRSRCDFLVVGLMTDPTIDRKNKMKPLQTTMERYIQLCGFKGVDLIVPLDTENDIINLLKILKPDIRFVGEEYKGVEFTGKDLGIEIYYNNRQHDYSSTKIKQKI